MYVRGGNRGADRAKVRRISDTKRSVAKAFSGAGGFCVRGRRFCVVRSPALVVFVVKMDKILSCGAFGGTACALPFRQAENLIFPQGRGCA